VLPPLRERRDLSWLIHRMLAAAAGEAAPPQLSAAASARLHAHAWPGNLRELHNVIDFACAVCSGGVIEVGDLPDEFQPHRGSPARGADGVAWPDSTHDAAAGDDAALLLSYLRASNWNVSAVARQLGVARMTLYRRMKRWGIVHGDGG
jgi:sigma-54 dependent transcriptional regulator, acetoin dehydrogenase operon transcriptional activator AcoR